MKHKFNLITILIVLMMSAGINLVHAQTSYGIQIAGTSLTSANAGAITDANFPGLGLTNGTITYNHSNKTFTLNNVNADAIDAMATFIDITSSADAGEYKINLVGNNAITSIYGIFAHHNLTIEGSGSLYVSASSPIYIPAGNKTLTIRNTTVGVSGDVGIQGPGGGGAGTTLNIENSTVRANGGYGSIFDFQDITLIRCSIIQPAVATVAINGSNGMAVMKGGSVVTSQVVIEPSYGIKIAGTNLSEDNAGAINNTNFPGLGLTQGTITYDHSTKTFTLNNVNADAISADATFIDITSNADVGEYKINLVGNNAITSIYGIYTRHNLTIEGSGSLYVSASAPIYVPANNKTLAIRNTTVEVSGDFGIAGPVGGGAGTTLNIENSTVRANGGLGSIYNFQDITLIRCAITQPSGAMVNYNGSNGKAVMKGGSVVTSQVVIEPSYSIQIADTELKEANAGAITNANFPNLGLTSGSITYDHSTKTFTLNNVNANVDADAFIYISTSAETAEYKINLVGNNVVNSRVDGIFMKKNLTIEGSGSLKLTLSTDNGIYLGENTTVTIRNTTVEVIAGYGVGIVGIDGTRGEKLVVENSTVKATGEGGSIFDLQDITLTGCAVTQPAGARVNYNGSNGMAVMKGGSVVTSQVLIEPSYGIQIADTELKEVNVGAINNTNFPNLGLTSGSITYDHSTKTFTLNNVNANVSADAFIYISTSAETAEYKINLVGNNVVNSTVDGIVMEKNLTIEGSGSLKITSVNDKGIYVFDNTTLTIRNTTVEVAGFYGITGNDGRSGEKLLIENSTVKADALGGGIFDLQDITLIGCAVTQPAGAEVVVNGSSMAVMEDISVVPQVVITPTTANMSRWVELTVVQGEHIELNLKASVNNTLVRIVSGATDTTVVVGTSYTGDINYYAGASSMKVYGDVTYFECSYNYKKVTALDLSNNTSLVQLDCRFNSLETLDASGLNALEYLDCGGNQIHSLNINGLSALKNLRCNGNRLTSLDLSGCVALIWVYCHENNFTTQALDFIYCSLPTKDVIDGANIRPIFDATSSDYETVIATNKQNALNKNWIVLYVGGDGIPATTGSYICGTPVPATVTTGDAATITLTTATLNGVVYPGTDVIAERGFEWKLTSGGTYADLVSSSTDDTFTADLTGLADGTSYTFRAYVKVGTTKTYGLEKTFTTKYIYTLPYTMGFEDTEAYNDWTIVDANGDGRTFTRQITGGNMAPACMRYSYSSSNAANDWLISPVIALPANTQVGVRLYARRGSSSLPEKFKIMFGQGTTPTDFTQELLLVDNMNTMYDEYSVVFTSPTTAGNYNIAIQAVSDADMYRFYIDDISVFIHTPATVTTSDATNITQTTATLNGTVNPGTDVIAERGFEWKETAGGTYADLVSSSTDDIFTADLTGLTANTNYTFKAYVKVGEDKVYGEEKNFTTVATGIENAAQAVAVYPNPARDIITIETDVIGSVITITDLAGCTVIYTTVTETKTTLDIRQLKAGIYVVRVGEKIGKIMVR